MQSAAPASRAERGCPRKEQTWKQPPSVAETPCWRGCVCASVAHWMEEKFPEIPQDRTACQEPPCGTHWVAIEITGDCAPPALLCPLAGKGAMP